MLVDAHDDNLTALRRSVREVIRLRTENSTRKAELAAMSKALTDRSVAMAKENTELRARISDLLENQ